LQPHCTLFCLKKASSLDAGSRGQKEGNTHVRADFRHHWPLPYCISLSFLLLPSSHLESRIIFLYLKRMAFLTEGDLRFPSYYLRNRQTADHARIIGTLRSRPQATGPEEFVTKRFTVSVTVQLRHPQTRFPRLHRNHRGQ
jgi:hypothetical protein